MSIYNIFMELLLFIDQLVYKLISIFFQLFIVISKLNLFGTEELTELIDRIFLVLGVAMLFFLAYEVLILIANPEKLSGESRGKTMVIKFVGTIIIFFLLPTIFNYLFVFQNNVIESNFLSNLILGDYYENFGKDGDLDELFAGVEESAYSYVLVKRQATEMTLRIASTFYHPNISGRDYSLQNCQELLDLEFSDLKGLTEKDTFGELSVADLEFLNDSKKVCEEYINIWEVALKHDNPGYLFASMELKNRLIKKKGFFETWATKLGLIAGDGDWSPTMNYSYVMSTICGCIVLWMIIAYCLDIGVRVIKLGFYQIISPVPIVQNITKSEPLTQTKWFKNFISTYLDIFVRVGLIYFAIEIISRVPDLLKNLFADLSYVPFMVRMLAYIVMVLGILKFAKDAPDLIGEVFELKGGSVGLSLRKRLDENPYARTLMSGIGSAAAVGGSNIWNLGRNIKQAKGFGGKFDAALRGVGSIPGGILSGGARGLRSGSKMQSISELGATVGKVRDDAALKRTERDQRAIASRQRGEEIFGEQVPIAGRIVGRMANTYDGILSKGKFSPKKYQTTQAGVSRLEAFKDDILGNKFKGRVVNAEEDGEFRKKQLREGKLPDMFLDKSRGEINEQILDDPRHLEVFKNDIKSNAKLEERAKAEDELKNLTIERNNFAAKTYKSASKEEFFENQKKLTSFDEQIKEKKRVIENEEFTLPSEIEIGKKTTDLLKSMSKEEYKRIRENEAKHLNAMSNEEYSEKYSNEVKEYIEDNYSDLVGKIDKNTKQEKEALEVIGFREFANENPEILKAHTESLKTDINEICYNLDGKTLDKMLESAGLSDVNQIVELFSNPEEDQFEADMKAYNDFIKAMKKEGLLQKTAKEDEAKEKKSKIK